MDHKQICTWLGLPTNTWPPDHYTLLGLQPCESDGARIEQHVHERLARLRCYQLSHPAAATEAMNRLAQAFICLTDCQARKAYDAEFFPHLRARAENPAPPPVRAPKPRTQTAGRAAVPAVLDPSPPAQAPTPAGSIVDTAVVPPNNTQVDWKDATPPPVRVPASPEAEAPERVPADVAAVAPAPAALRAQAADPVFETARSSPEARRGLGTRRGLYERIVTTRRLLRAWARAGKYLGKPKRKLARGPEETELVRLLTRIDELLQSFPPLLGEPGQPGYRVVVLARDDAPVAMFNALDADHRGALALDWLAGQALLQSHRQFLRRELKRRRHQGWAARVVRALRAALNDHPVWVYVGVLFAIAVGAMLILMTT